MKGLKGSVVKGKRFHRKENGQLAECNADVRRCPREHFDSLEDARDGRQRSSKRIATDRHIPFSVTLGDKPRHLEPHMRQVAQRAAHLLGTSGFKTLAPEGDFTVPLMRGQKLRLKRETYDMNLDGAPFGVRYVVRHYSDENNYEEQQVDLNGAMDKVLLHRTLQSFLGRAGERANAVEAAQLREAFDTVDQTVAELEITARGVKNAHENLGMSVFSREIPGMPALKTSYTSGMLQPYHVEQAMKLLLKEGENPADASIEVSDPLGWVEGDHWSLSRLPGGDWYLSYTQEGEMTTEPLDSPRHIRAMLAPVLQRSGVDTAEANECVSYLESLMGSVERVVKSSRFSAPERDPRDLHNSPVKIARQAEGRRAEAASDELWDLFS